MIRAVRAALADEPYRSRFSFDVYPWESEKADRARAAYCFGRERHGFVVLAPDGRALACRPGHDYGLAEIRADLDRALSR